jgi:hypothetical protein
MESMNNIISQEFVKRSLTGGSPVAADAPCPQ